MVTTESFQEFEASKKQFFTKEQELVREADRRYANPVVEENMTQALDSLSLETLSGIKIDTEGHELQSLDGAARLIETFSPWLIIEFNTTLLPSRALTVRMRSSPSASASFDT